MRIKSPNPSILLLISGGALISVFAGLFWRPLLSAESTMLLLLQLLLIAPVSEEIIFRGILQKQLCRLHLLQANLCVSVVFAALHVLWLQDIRLALVFFPSLALGHLMDQHQRLSICVLAHSLWNLSFYVSQTYLATHLGMN